MNIDAHPPDHDAGRPEPRRVSLRDGRPCLLRSSTLDDAAELCGFLPRTHDETDMVNYLPGEFRKTVEQEAQWIREHYAKPNAIHLVAVVDGRIVASGGAASLELRKYAHQAGCGLSVLRDYWRLGIGRRIMERLVEWGRKRTLRKLTLRVFADNEPAIRLYRSLGFVDEGHLRDDARRVDGSLRDTIIMAKFYESP